MLRLTEFDLKTGQIFHERDSTTQTLQPRQKQVEHSYLEYWLQKHGITAPELFVAKFYTGVTDQDRLRLEAMGRVLVYSNGKNGYFADPQTAALLTQGSESLRVQSVYAADRASPHNLVAYGSLVSSDGIASTAIANARILVIDDEARTHGSGTLRDRVGEPIPAEELSRLYDKMGDGTMLISSQVMTELITQDEREQITRTVFAKAGISSDITTLAQDAEQVDAALGEIERQIQGRVNRLVTQFRAATTDLPGIIKGTMAASHWCERLGVAAIISKNDIKGDDGRLSEPGIKSVSDFWLNRKSDGQYGEQAVGPQVKGCIPEATLHEFNPRIKQQALELAEVAVDPRLLLQYYVQQKDKHRQLVTDEDENQPAQDRQDWLYEVAKADRFGMLTGFSKINHQLARFLKRQWQENVIQGVYVPSAMAQHHSQLQPWECCNKDLPHGAIVAYYRSPFPNVGAAAIAINNTEIIRQADPEAYRKEGVAYLNPWTAKNVAITDFDRDANGYFCGYTATVKDLPEQIRLQLQSVLSLPPAQQYEAGRSLFAVLVEQQATGAEKRIQPAQYPLAVQEFIQRNAPQCRPPEIVKQKKIKHSWLESETHSAALWRAWSVTADNPTGKVANIGMTLQSFALETQYIDPTQREPLLRQIADHYQKLLQKAADGKVEIPSDSQLEAAGFSGQPIQERIAEIAQAARQLDRISDPLQRQDFVQQKLGAVNRLLSDLVNGPIAMNLQTAVDTAKSSRGIDEHLHRFTKEIAHKRHLLRETQKDSNLYTHGKTIQTNTQEPIGWGAEEINRIYRDTQLPELINKSFRDLFPTIYTPEQEKQATAIAARYKSAMDQAFAVEARLNQNHRSDKQPTMQVLTPAGNQLTISRLCDGECNGDRFLWQTSGRQENWIIHLQRNQTDWQNSETVRALLTVLGSQPKLLGYIPAEQVAQHHLHERLRQSGGIAIVAPTVTLHPPYAVENDKDERMTRAMTERIAAVAAIPPPERLAYACALGHYSSGMDLVLKDFLPELTQQLQTVPPIRLRGLQHAANAAGQIPDGSYTVRFSQYSYLKADGEERTVPSVAVVIDGTEKQFGAIADHSIHLPIGTLIKAHIKTEGNIATVEMIDLLEHPLPRRLPEEIGKTPASLPLTIVTDGSCKGNPGPGGWGAILIQGNRSEEIGGGVLDTTNNRMEMVAGIEALRCARAQGMVDAQTSITLISDSQYFINGATGQWKHNANLDLWADYDRVAEGLQIQFEWVRGHSGHELNERVDTIAQAFALGQQPELSAKKIDHAASEKPMAQSQAGQQPEQQNFNAAPDPKAVDGSQIVYLEHITRDLVQSQPQAVFLFGDNLQGRGLGGQAGAMRGEPNAIGIPTKHSSSTVPAAFFIDADLPIVKPAIDERIRQVQAALAAGKTVYVPAAGFGTGLAQLPERAPQIYAYLQDRLREVGIEPLATARPQTERAAPPLPVIISQNASPNSVNELTGMVSPAVQQIRPEAVYDVVMKPLAEIAFLQPYYKDDPIGVEQVYEQLSQMLSSRTRPEVIPEQAIWKFNQLLKQKDFLTFDGRPLQLQPEQFAELCRFSATRQTFSVRVNLSDPKPYNPIATVTPITASVAQHQIKDRAMGEIATQFIGYPATPDHVASSTRSYLQAWEKIGRANTGVYSIDDIVMVSGSGPWRRAADKRTATQIENDIQQTFTQRVVPLLDQVIVANARIVVGDAKGTDLLVQQYMREHGYRLTVKEGYYLMNSERNLINQGVITPTGKPIQMTFNLRMHGEPNPLPVDSCFEAMRGYGRCHTTRMFQPHAAYGITEGDVAIVYSGSQQIAVRVGEQYRITAGMIADPNYQQQWAAMEKHSSIELQSFRDKPIVWGLHVEPLGDFVDGKIVPFPPTLPLRSIEVTTSAISFPTTQAHAAYDPESLTNLPVAGKPTASDSTAAVSAMLNVDQSVAYHPSRGELLEWLSVARAIGSPEQKEAIMGMGLALKEQYNQEQGTVGVAPPMEYRHFAVVVSEQAYLQMNQAVAQLRISFAQMQAQQSVDADPVIG